MKAFSKLVERLGYTLISVNKAYELFKYPYGIFDLKERLKRGELAYGCAEQQPNGTWKYKICKEMYLEEMGVI